jgi:UDP-N-acetylglucosamine--N-acetylmuramyl-(pentapeptide) pyrophosphoryl-undecaprenol N-acetylglucosamine transferase
MKVLLTGGGTGGHVYPAIAIAEALTDEPAFAPLEILFVGMRAGMESGMVAKAGLRGTYVSAAPLTRKFSPAIFTLFANVAGFFQALGILHRFRPDVAIATRHRSALDGEGPALIASAHRASRTQRTRRPDQSAIASARR